MSRSPETRRPADVSGHFARAAASLGGEAQANPLETLSTRTNKSRTAETPKLSVFLSYSRDDRGFADMLAAGLGARSIDVVMDREGIRHGEEFWRRIQDLIVQCNVVVFLISPPAINSNWCRNEIAFARESAKLIVPVRFRSERGMIVPPELSGIHYVDCGEFGRAYADVAQAARKLRLAEDEGIEGEAFQQLLEEHDCRFAKFASEVRESDGFGKALHELGEALRIKERHWEDEKTKWLERAQAWERAGRTADRLLGQWDIRRIEAWEAGRPNVGRIPTIIAEFSAASRRASAWWWRLVLGGVVAVAITMAVLAGAWYLQRNEARDNADAANRERDRAVAALRTQSQMLADAVTVRRGAGDRTGAALLALEGLPDERSPDELRRDWPYVPQLERNAYEKLLPLDELSVDPMPSESDDMLAHAGVDRVLIGGHLYEISSGREIAKIPDLASQRSPTVSFEKGGDWIAYIADGSVRVVDSADRNPVVLGLSPHDDIAKFEFDPAGTALATIHDDGAIRLQRLAGVGETPVLIRKASGGDDYFMTAAFGSVVFDSGGTRLVAVPYDTTATLWDTRSGKLVKTITDEETIRRAVFDTEGDRFVTLPDAQGSELSVHMYSSGDGSLIQSFRGHTEAVLDAEFVSGGTRLVTASRDNTAKIWSIQTGDSLATLARHSTDVVNVALVGRDGERILTVGATDNANEQDDVTLRLWDANGQFLGELDPKGLWVSALEVGDANERAFIAVTDGESVHRINIVDLTSGATTHSLTGMRGIVRGMAPTQKGDILVSIADDRAIRRWSARSPTAWRGELNVPPTQPTTVFGEGPLFVPPALESVAVDDSGRTIFAVSSDGTLATSSQAILQYPKPTRLFGTVGLGLHREEKALVLFSLVDGTIVDRAGAEAEGEGARAVVDANTAAWAFAEGDVIRVRSLGGTAVETRLDASGTVSALALSRDGTLLVGIAASQIRLWDVKTRRLRDLGPVPDDEVVEIVFDPASGRFAVVAEGGRVSVWTRHGEPVSSITAEGPVNARETLGRQRLVAALVPGGAQLLLGTGHRIAIWSLTEGGAILEASLEGHDATVTTSRDHGGIEYTRDTKVSAIAVSAAGKRVVSVGTDGKGIVWDLDARAVVGMLRQDESTLRGHGRVVRAIPQASLTWSGAREAYYFLAILNVSLSPNEEWIVTGSSDGTARVWPFFPTRQAFVDHLRAEVPRCLSTAERTEAQLSEAPPAWCSSLGKWPYASSIAGPR